MANADKNLAPMASGIAISDLTFGYPGSLEPILNIASWHLPPGANVFIRGPSGCGKSTFLSVISGLLSATQGNVHVLGKDLQAMTQRKRDHFRARNMGFVFQKLNLVPFLNTFDNIRLSAYYAGLSKDQIRAFVENVCEQMMLPKKLLQRPVSQLSVGQQQRVSIARAICHQPTLILADEPTSSLDDATAEMFMNWMLDSCSRSGASLLMVSHDNRLMAHFDRCEEMQEISSTCAHAD